MQTFLPYPSFAESAKVLDNKRLNKQIVEAYQILKAITLPDYGWQNHPAVNMWRGFPVELFQYAYCMYAEKNFRTHMPHKAYWNMMDFFYENYEEKLILFIPEKFNMPSFIGNEQFHLSHKSNLIRKFPEHYRKFWPDVPDNIPYYWPTKQQGEKV